MVKNYFGLMIFSILEFFLNISIFTSYSIVKILIFLRWKLRLCGRPQFYNQIYNYIQWIKNPKSNDFLYRGILPKLSMKKNSTILDVCCGDGSTAYLFWSDVAKSIDCIDIDADAISEAKNRFSSNNIRYFIGNILGNIESLPILNKYDYIVMNSALCYFDIDGINKIFKFITKRIDENGMFFCYFPVSNKYIDHKTEFSSINSVMEIFGKYFASTEIQVIRENNSDHFFVASKGKLDD